MLGRRCGIDIDSCDEGNRDSGSEVRRGRCDLEAILVLRCLDPRTVIVSYIR